MSSRKKLQVFISSTYQDLIEERQAAVSAILNAGHIPAGMELFTAGDQSQMTVIKRWIDNSDVFLLILGGRYGSIEPITGKSYTQLEYEYAKDSGKPLFALVASDQALDSKTKVLGRAAVETDNGHKLREFRNLVLSVIVKKWDDIKDIKIGIADTMPEFDLDSRVTGWVRADKHVDTAAIAEEIARLTRENARLVEQVSGPVSSSPELREYGGLTYDELSKLLGRTNVGQYTRDHLVSTLSVSTPGDLELEKSMVTEYLAEHFRKLNSQEYYVDTRSSEANLLEALQVHELVNRIRRASGKLVYVFSGPGRRFMNRFRQAGYA